MSWIQDYVQSYLTFAGKCFRHCDKQTHMRIIKQTSSRIIGAYVCPEAFVSQVVYFTAAKPDLKWFRELIARQIGTQYVTKRDVRTASRHGWELGGEARLELEKKIGPEGKITEIYWSRYPKTQREKQQAVSLCIGDSKTPGCGRLFVHSKATSPLLCDKCKSKIRKR
jgi:hypothetical protein